jgi:RNA polymerase sigma factor (sigma-70 family)
MSDGGPACFEPGPLSPEQRFLNYSRSGDKATIQSLIEDFADRSYALARRITGDADGAEDAVQDAYVRLVSTAKRYDGSVSFSSWIARLVNAAALDYRRRRAVRRTHLSDMNSEEAEAMKIDPRTTELMDPPELDLLRTTLDSLPDRYRTPLTLHYFGGLDRNETAHALGVPTITLAKQLERGLEHLRVKLGRAGFAVTSAGLIGIFSSAPAYSAPPTFIASLTATRRLAQISRHASEHALTAKKASMSTGSIFFKAAVVGALAVAAAASLLIMDKIAPSQAATMSYIGHGSFGPTAWPIPGVIEAEDYDMGGEGVGFHHSEGPGNSSSYRPDGNDIGDDRGNIFIGWTLAGEWLNYNVNVAKAGTYRIETRVSAWDSGGTFHIEFEGVDKTGPIAMPAHSGGLRRGPLDWQTLQTTASLAAGQQAMRIVLDGNGVHNYEVSNLDWIRLTALDATPADP